MFPFPHLGKNLGDQGICDVGDVVGCGFLIVENEKPMSATQHVVVYFIKNQSIVHHCNIEMSVGGFYPTAAFTMKGLYSALFQLGFEKSHS